MTGPSPATPAKRRKRFGLSLRVLMVLVLLLGGGMGWYAYRARVQREAVAAIVAAGGEVLYDWEVDRNEPLFNIAPEPSRAKKLLVKLLGPDYVGDVLCVFLEDQGDKVDDLLLQQVGRLRRLKVLHLDGCTVSDAGLPHLSQLSELIELSLDHTTVSDAGLPYLYGISKCEDVGLFGTKVTMEGIARLRERMPSARIVDIQGNRQYPDDPHPRSRGSSK